MNTFTCWKIIIVFFMALLLSVVTFEKNNKNLLIWFVQCFYDDGGLNNFEACRVEEFNGF